MLRSKMHRFKRYGLPFAGGWAEQPADFMTLIESFDNVLAKWEEEDRRRKEAERKHD